MTKIYTLESERLLLRPWCEEDFEPFAKMNSDPRVREYFPSLLTREESDISAGIAKEWIEKNGWGFWAVSVKDLADFIGFIGMQNVPFDAPFTPAVEIGWRLAFEHWDKGYATEGALAALKFGFETLKLNEIVAFTALENRRSRKVMEKIGMTHSSEDDFDHPKIPVGHPLRKQALYRTRSNK